jgi:pimeloyl-ACP methyl ester carboxylesterase
MTDCAKGGVLFLHGLGRRAGSMRMLAAAASAEGYATFSPAYPGRRRSLTGIVDHLAAKVAAFDASFGDPLHIVTHSLGGLVARALIEARPPGRLGRVVMLAPPNGGSEVADLIYRVRLNRILLGPVGAHLRTRRIADDEKLLGKVGFELGIIAGSRGLDPISPRLIFARPNDGKVAVAATHVEGMRDHIVLAVSHTLMVYDRRVVAQTMAFLKQGRFRR